MHGVEASVYDSNFDNKFASLSAKHLQSAKLIKENVNQQENNDKDYDKILDRISTKMDPNSKYVTPGKFGVGLLNTPSIQVFTLPKDKWKDSQAMLQAFFKGNPSPVCQPQAPLANTASSPAAIFVGVQANAITTQASVNNQSAFDPISFMQQHHAQMMAAVQQKSQTIVVESCEGKTCESEAKFKNNMLQLLLIRGIVDFSSPGSFTVPRIKKYTQAMKNILLFSLLLSDPSQWSTFS